MSMFSRILNPTMFIVEVIYEFVFKQINRVKNIIIKRIEYNAAPLKGSTDDLRVFSLRTAVACAILCRLCSIV